MFCYSTVCVKTSDSDSQKPARKSTFSCLASDHVLSKVVKNRFCFCTLLLTCFYVFWTRSETELGNVLAGAALVAYAGMLMHIP